MPPKRRPAAPAKKALQKAPRRAPAQGTAAPKPPKPVARAKAPTPAAQRAPPKPARAPAAALTSEFCRYCAAWHADVVDLDTPCPPKHSSLRERADYADVALVQAAGAARASKRVPGAGGAPGAAGAAETASKTVASDVPDGMDCPICQNLMFEPVVICPQNHTCCKECAYGIDRCGECRHKTLSTCSILPLAVRAIDNLQCHCPHAPCRWVGTIAQLPTHERECAERMVTCETPDCGWEGRRRELAAHDEADMSRHFQLERAARQQLEERLLQMVE